MQRITGIGEIIENYDALVLDLWGVVHDGIAPYPGVIDCLAALRDRGVKVVMLSNAPRRATAAGQGLRGMSITESHYDAIVTSGEVTRAMLEQADPLIASWGKRFWHLGPPRDRNLFEGLKFIEVALDGADFILNTGPDDERDPTDPAAFDAELHQALKRGLPMLCANPDLEVMRGGKRIICAGLLAERYQAMGGEVVTIGKPDPRVYQSVFEIAAVPAERLLAIGDSLRTDIAGARAVGIDHVWVLGGIHHDDPDPERSAQAVGQNPHYIIPRFIW